jgi:hypothetical protein
MTPTLRALADRGAPWCVHYYRSGVGVVGTLTTPEEVEEVIRTLEVARNLMRARAAMEDENG